MKKLLATERIGDRTERWWLHTGEDGSDRITVETEQDVEVILDANKAQYTSAPSSFGKGSFHKVATIPATVIEEVCRVKQISFHELMANQSDRARYIWGHLLNAPEFRSFRTRPGHVDTRAR